MKENRPPRGRAAGRPSTPQMSFRDDAKGTPGHRQGPSARTGGSSIGRTPVLVDVVEGGASVLLQLEHGYLVTSPASARALAALLLEAADTIEGGDAQG